MKFLEKISGFFYPIVVVCIVAGLFWQGMSWLDAHSGTPASRIPSGIAQTAGIIAVVAFTWLMEKLMPIRALSELRWVYRERPRQRRRSLDADSVTQLIANALFGSIVGAALGHAMVGAVGAVALRAFLGALKPARLSQLLSAGRTRLIGLSSLHVQDNELASDALTGMWMSSPRAFARPLALRRLQRRSYLLVIALIQCANALATANSAGIGAFIVFSLTWTILGAGVYRCGDLRKLTPTPWPGYFMAAGHALVGMAFMAYVWPMPWTALAMMAVAIGFGSYQRGQPRRVVSLTYVDNGMGMSAPPELVYYYLKGLPLVVMAAGAALAI
ncbi:hypothetical protein CKALI_00850 [Corynebacterium kalinowskii]|uniref:Uncharacterized protein n=1 Tax=Corynebacterium kalinowskii TaxID=2675216 RepID=A0A6B8VMU3_9CORY|nr:hypothetical protein [Corynebacterium kalinowskii]QGU01071.1 hypothetical protein CKALI_00850 [Corynebacterium kalinowskii]